MKEKERIDIRLTNDSVTWNLVVEVEKFIGRQELMPHMSGKTAYCSSSTSIKCSHSDLIGLVSLASITINELIEKNWATVETLEKVVEFLAARVQHEAIKESQKDKVVILSETTIEELKQLLNADSYAVVKTLSHPPQLSKVTFTRNFTSVIIAAGTEVRTDDNGVTYVLGEEGREYIGWQKDGTKNKKK